MLFFNAISKCFKDNYKVELGVQTVVVFGLFICFGRFFHWKPTRREALGPLLDAIMKSKVRVPQQHKQNKVI